MCFLFGLGNLIKLAWVRGKYFSFDIKGMHKSLLTLRFMDLTKCIHDYFSGEKKGSLFLLGLSVLMLLLSYIIYKYVDHSVGFGFAASLAFFSGIHILVSLIRYALTLSRASKLRSNLEDEMELRHEWQRMKEVTAKFPKVRIVQEIIFGFALLGIILGIAKCINPISMGFSMAVIFQAALLIVYDLFAQRRAEEYERRLRLILGEKKEKP